jgi:hypothetical protein
LSTNKQHSLSLESLEIRRGGVLEVSLAFAELRISRISGADRVFGLEHPELGMLLYFEDDASFSEFLGQRWPTHVFRPCKVVLSCEEKMKAPIPMPSPSAPMRKMGPCGCTSRVKARHIRTRVGTRRATARA